jgi:hypothetical protein
VEWVFRQFAVDSGEWLIGQLQVNIYCHKNDSSTELLPANTEWTKTEILTLPPHLLVYTAFRHRFQQGIFGRQIFGGMFAAGCVLLVLDMLAIGKHEARPARSVPGDR